MADYRACLAIVVPAQCCNCSHEIGLTSHQANAMLGNWSVAYKDLTKAQQLDFDDEQIFDWMPEVKKNGIAQQEHERTYERKVEERARREKLRLRTKAKRDYERSKSSSSSGGGGGGTAAAVRIVCSRVLVNVLRCAVCSQILDRLSPKT